MADGQPQKGVSDCYIFKSRLQEYAQKVGIPTPEYHTLKEGPSHEPVFKSTVLVNNVTYESLPGFFNRKSAEQSAAEVALSELEKSGKTTECLPTLHETGLCKNLLQEYAQKMNYAIPCYQCTKQGSGESLFSCTVEIGGIQYIGAVAKSKKEAEIKAARTALLAIQSSSFGSESNGFSRYTVLPVKKKGKDVEIQTVTVNNVKQKRLEAKKKRFKKKFLRNKGTRAKRNKTEQGTTSGESTGIEFVNGGTLVTVGSSGHGQSAGPGIYTNGQGIDVGRDNALVQRVEHRGPLSFGTDANYLRSKWNKNEQKISSGDVREVEYVNGGTTETVGPSEQGQPNGPNLVNSGQGVDTGVLKTLVQKVDHSGLRFETDVNYLPLVKAAPQVSEVGNPAVVAE